jgi:hypothetical protein
MSMPSLLCPLRALCRLWVVYRLRALVLLLPQLLVHGALGAQDAQDLVQLGKPVSAADITASSYNILPDGTGLPAGSGSVITGAVIYQQKCQVCHGEEGSGGVNDRLAGGLGTLASARPLLTVGSYWPYATTLFDYVRRAMPYTAPGSLSADEVYALTAYLLQINGIVAADALMDAQTLPQVMMPNRGGFDCSSQASAACNAGSGAMR